MSKKNFTSGLDSILLGGVTKDPKPKPAPKTTPTPPKETRATFIVDPQDVEKLKAIAYWERLKMKDVADEMLKGYIKAYEKKHGEVKPLPNK